MTVDDILRQRMTSAEIAEFHENVKRQGLYTEFEVLYETVHGEDDFYYIMNFITWHETPQGYNYWRDIAHRDKKQIPSTLKDLIKLL